QVTVQNNATGFTQTFATEAEGQFLFRRGDLDRAIQHPQKALELLPNDSISQYNLARALQKAGRAADADAMFQAFHQVNQRARNSELAKATTNLGNDLIKSGDIEQGTLELQEALRLNPEDGVARYNYGVALLLQRKLGEAIEQFRTALRLKPDQPNAHYYL